MFSALSGRKAPNRPQSRWLDHKPRPLNNKNLNRNRRESDQGQRLQRHASPCPPRDFFISDKYSFQASTTSVASGINSRIAKERERPSRRQAAEQLAPNHNWVVRAWTHFPIMWMFGSITNPACILVLVLLPFWVANFARQKLGLELQGSHHIIRYVWRWP